jgi:transcriptional regulator with XRE-family HTH domain
MIMLTDCVDSRTIAARKGTLIKSDHSQKETNNIMANKSAFRNMPVSSELTNQLTPKALSKQEFGRRLYKLMLEKNWNQSDLARAADLGRDSVSTYINAKTFPTPKALKKLADCFGMEPGDLLPNSIMNAMDDEFPAIELRQAAGHPGKAWLRLNRAISFEAAVRIVAIIDAEDNPRTADTEG